jgi:hypothetical protein
MILLHNFVESVNSKNLKLKKNKINLINFRFLLGKNVQINLINKSAVSLLIIQVNNSLNNYKSN